MRDESISAGGSGGYFLPTDIIETLIGNREPLMLLPIMARSNILTRCGNLLAQETCTQSQA